MIDYRNELNEAQYEAVSTLHGPVLVIAGAGSGKTRTIVYRLAHLMESGIAASSILLLTFTRKAAQEMLERARLLLRQGGMDDLNLAALQGGTFHSYAYSVLRIFPPEGYMPNLTVMDSHDILAALQHCRAELKIGKGDRSFPKNQTVNGILSKSRNKESSLEDVLRRDSTHLLPHAAAMQELGEAYAVYKREKNLLDYDDLLFCLEDVLKTRPEALDYCRRRHSHIMVDEYQDTNPVQARIAGMVAGLCTAAPQGGAYEAGGQDAGGDRGNAGDDRQGAEERQNADSGPDAAFAPGRGNIMVVGDDAQSIYAFRGADVRNILRFPDLFPGTKVIRLEQNYRSTQPLLDISNAVLANAAEGFSKHLFTLREDGKKPTVIRPMTDRSQAGFVTGRILELMRQYPPGEIAVLVRAGFHSYAVEVALSKMGVPFRKYGGIRYAEAAHVKDVMSFVRLVQNPLDFTAFTRMAELSKGVGPKTCLKLYQLAQSGDGEALAKAAGRYPSFAGDLMFVDAERRAGSSPASLLTRAVEHYRPRLEELFPDDYPRRMQGLEQLIQIAGAYDSLDLLIADLSLEDPSGEEEKSDSIVLSTIHSAKGLEWSAVLILDLVEERFPSRHALARPDDYEEERRLMYVACTRARDFLELYVPSSIYDKGSGGSIPAVPSPFVRELAPELYVEWQENYGGGLVIKDRTPPGMDVFARRPATAFRQPGSAGGPFRADSPASGNGFGSHGNALVAPSKGTNVSETDGDGFTSGRERENPGDADWECPSPGTTAGSPALPPSRCGYCRHRIFGRGKIVQHLPPDKYKVNFPGLGLKVIMAAYLSMEE